MPEPIDPDRIRDYLRGAHRAPILAVAEAVSTNDLAAEAGRAGAEEGWTVFAERQTKGRGRMGRSWEGGDGESLMFSMILRPVLGLRGWPRLTTMAGVAVAEAVEMVAECEARIKWPNDIFVSGRKLAGILAETFSGENPFAVLGIGLNVGQSHFPPPIDGTAISLRQITGAIPDRNLVAAAVLDRITFWQTRLPDDFGKMVAEASRRSCIIGREVALLGGDGTRFGTAKGLDPEGGLIVATAGGKEIVVTSGEVSLRVVS